MTTAKMFILVPTPGNGEGGRWPDKEGIYQAVSRHGLCQTAFNGDALKAQCSWLQEGITHWLEQVPKSPFAEWEKVPVTVENMKPMSFWGLIDGSDSESVFYLNYSKWDISVSIRRDRIMLGLPDVSYSIHPRDIAHLLEIISGFDPQAFEKGGEG